MPSAWNRSTASFFQKKQSPFRVFPKNKYGSDYAESWFIQTCLLLFFSFHLPGSGCMLIKLLAKLHRSCWIWLNSCSASVCRFLWFVFNLEINIGYRNISIPFPFGISFHTESCYFCRYSSNTNSFYLESQTGECNSPVPLFSLFCQHWRPPDRDCETVLMYIILGIYTRQFVETMKVCIRRGDCTFNFFRCSEFS